MNYHGLPPWYPPRLPFGHPYLVYFTSFWLSPESNSGAPAESASHQNDSNVLLHAPAFVGMSRSIIILLFDFYGELPF